MSFGISAGAWMAAAAVATTAYSTDRQRKAVHQQMDAERDAIAEDARKAAEAETSAQVAANAQLAEAKRRRRNGALGLGDPGVATDTLGGAAAPMSASTPRVGGFGGFAGRVAAVAAGRAASTGGTALGAGASPGIARSYTPKGGLLP